MSHQLVENFKEILTKIFFTWSSLEYAQIETGEEEQYNLVWIAEIWTL